MTRRPPHVRKKTNPIQGTEMNVHIETKNCQDQENNIFLKSEIFCSPFLVLGIHAVLNINVKMLLLASMVSVLVLGLEVLVRVLQNVHMVCFVLADFAQRLTIW